MAYDQLRNGHQVKRNGHGIMLNKMDLATPEPLKRAVTDILSNDKFPLELVGWSNTFSSDTENVQMKLRKSLKKDHSP